MNAAISSNKPPIADKPLPISSQLIVEKSLHAEASIFMAPANAIRPIEPLIIFEPVADIITEAATNSQRRTETPVNPTAN